MAAEISVIVPVYNTEKYVEECIESVLAQTYTDFELILIDDGSEDNSREICREMWRKDDRIRLIQMEHRGVSAARNAGMDAAVGKYLFFQDSDDMIHPQLLEALYEVQEKNQTVIVAEGWYEVEDGGLQKSKQWEMKNEGIWDNIHIDDEKSIYYCLVRDIDMPMGGIGGKMILREAANLLRFDEKLTHGEDMWFLYQLYAKGTDASVLSLNWYYYRLHELSAVKIFSIIGCRSRYISKCYIRRHELEIGRISNIKHLEWAILSEIIEWHEDSRRIGDAELTRVIKELFKNEKTTEIFLELKWWNKLEAYLGFYCHSAYRIIYKVLNSMKN